MKRSEIKLREDLTGEHTFGDLGQLLFLFLFLGIWIPDSFFLHFSTFLSKSISLFIRLPLGLMVLIISGSLAGKGLKIVFGEIRDKPSVIRKGVFKIVRHPIYLGSILLYLGLFFLTFSLLSAIVLIAILGFYYYLCRHEEQLLLKRFGREYQDYLKEVPMLIPKIK